jgi:protein tyrosine/serine phosphatase
LSLPTLRCYPADRPAGSIPAIALRNSPSKLLIVTSNSLINKLSRKAFGLIAVLAIVTAVLAQKMERPPEGENVPIRIKNFGQMDARFYRGAQPAKEDYKGLAALGINTVIDLREDPKSYERPLVESLGMKYVNIPMIDKSYPTPEVTALFLKTVNDPATGKFFVHCAGGRHRTGAMGAVYRFQFYDWTFDQAYQEMKHYDFYTNWGHEAFKDFVLDYYAKARAQKEANSVKTQNRF